MAIMSLSIKASEKIVYYCEQDQMSVIDSKFIVDKFNKISSTLREISNFKINIQKEIIFYKELDPNLSEETALNDLNNNFHIQVNKNKDNYIKAIDFRGKEMYLFKEEEKIKRIPVIKPYQHSDSYSALHLFPIQLELEQIEKSRKETFNELRDNGIGVNVHYIPIHTQPYYEKLGFKKGDFPNSEYYYSRAITLPLFHDMTFDQQDKVCEVLKDILK